MICVPLRLSLAGGGTDVEPFSSDIGAKILNFAISLNINIVAAVRESRQKSIKLRIMSKEVVEEPTQFQAQLEKALVKRLPSGASLNLKIVNPVGPGSGLGTSSTLIVACRLFIESIFPLNLTEEDIIIDSFKIERKEMMIEGGFQDFFPAVFGGMNWLVQAPGQSKVHGSKIKPPPKIVKLLQNMYVLELGIPRDGATIIKDQINRYKESFGETRTSLISQLKIAEDVKSAIDHDDPEWLLALIEEGYKIKKKFTPLITNPIIDNVEHLLRRLGARGIKISGAGGGGHMFCFFPGGIPIDVQTQLPTHTKKVECSYTEIGWQIEKKP